MNFDLNLRASRLVDAILPQVDLLRIALHSSPIVRVLDFGIDVAGGLEAGLALARICTSGLAEISLVPGEIDGYVWPHLQVTTDHPVAACLFSQYAGWQLAVDKYFAMGSGPMRAASAREELFRKLGYKETPALAVGVLEGRKFPTSAVCDLIAEKTGVPKEHTTLLIAPTASIAGTFQVVARVVETALHKLHEVGYDVTRIRSATGTAPLAPIAKNDLAGIGVTNDAILYGGRVTLWVADDDATIAAIGPKVPASSSAMHGEPFLTIFERAGNDFYKIDPLLFSPAEIVFQNLSTGRVQRFGKTAPKILKRSFGM